MQEKEVCNKTRKIIDTINWDCNVKTNYNHINLGCKISVSNAINWFFSEENEGVILEDDCLPSLDFYKFCSLMLVRHRDDNNIGSITGTKISPLKSYYKNDSFASKYPNVWGWATWKRVWNKYDVCIENWESDWQINNIDNYLNNKETSIYWKNIFTKVYNGEIDTWDYQFIFLFLKEKFKCIVPNYNLIQNIGFDSEATHTLSENSWISRRKIESALFAREIITTDFENINEHYDLNLERFVFGIRKPSLFQRILRYLHSELN
jgi:hypothetical protein